MSKKFTYDRDHYHEHTFGVGYAPDDEDTRPLEPNLLVCRRCAAVIPGGKLAKWAVETHEEHAHGENSLRDYYMPRMLNMAVAQARALESIAATLTDIRISGLPVRDRGVVDALVRTLP